jgi:hypothetical protein
MFQISFNPLSPVTNIISQQRYLRLILCLLRERREAGRLNVGSSIRALKRFQFHTLNSRQHKCPDSLTLLSVFLPTNSLIRETRVQYELGDEPKQIRAFKQLPQRTPLLSLSLLLLVWILIEGSVMEGEPLRHSLRRTQEERRDYDRRNSQRDHQLLHHLRSPLIPCNKINRKLTGLWKEERDREKESERDGER